MLVRLGSRLWSERITGFSVGCGGPGEQHTPHCYGSFGMSERRELVKRGKKALTVCSPVLTVPDSGNSGGKGRAEGGRLSIPRSWLCAAEWVVLAL